MRASRGWAGTFGATRKENKVVTAQIPRRLVNKKVERSDRARALPLRSLTVTKNRARHGGFFMLADVTAAWTNLPRLGSHASESHSG
jgi:hypothetical protein